MRPQPHPSLSSPPTPSGTPASAVPLSKHQLSKSPSPRSDSHPVDTKQHEYAVSSTSYGTHYSSCQTSEVDHSPTSSASTKERDSTACVHTLSTPSTTTAGADSTVDSHMVMDSEPAEISAKISKIAISLKLDQTSDRHNSENRSQPRPPSTQPARIQLISAHNLEVTKGCVDSPLNFIPSGFRKLVISQYDLEKLLLAWGAMTIVRGPNTRNTFENIFSAKDQASLNELASLVAERLFHKVIFSPKSFVLSRTESSDTRTDEDLIALLWEQGASQQFAVGNNGSAIHPTSASAFAAESVPLECFLGATHAHLHGLSSRIILQATDSCEIGDEGRNGMDASRSLSFEIAALDGGGGRGVSNVHRKNGYELVRSPRGFFTAIVMLKRAGTHHFMPIRLHRVEKVADSKISGLSGYILSAPMLKRAPFLLELGSEYADARSLCVHSVAKSSQRNMNATKTHSAHPRADNTETFNTSPAPYLLRSASILCHSQNAMFDGKAMNMEMLVQQEGKTAPVPRTYTLCFFSTKEINPKTPLRYSSLSQDIISARHDRRSESDHSAAATFRNGVSNVKESVNGIKQDTTLVLPGHPFPTMKCEERNRTAKIWCGKFGCPCLMTELMARDALPWMAPKVEIMPADLISRLFSRTLQTDRCNGGNQISRLPENTISENANNCMSGNVATTACREMETTQNKNSTGLCMTVSKNVASQQSHIELEGAQYNVWGRSFGVTRQARPDGIAFKLAADAIISPANVITQSPAKEGTRKLTQALPRTGIVSRPSQGRIGCWLPENSALAFDITENRKQLLSLSNTREEYSNSVDDALVITETNATECFGLNRKSVRRVLSCEGSSEATQHIPAVVQAISRGRSTIKSPNIQNGSVGTIPSGNGLSSSTEISVLKQLIPKVSSENGEAVWGGKSNQSDELSVVSDLSATCCSVIFSRLRVSRGPRRRSAGLRSSLAMAAYDKCEPKPNDRGISRAVKGTKKCLARIRRVTKGVSNCCNCLAFRSTS